MLPLSITVGSTPSRKRDTSVVLAQMNQVTRVLIALSPTPHFLLVFWFFEPFALFYQKFPFLFPSACHCLFICQVQPSSSTRAAIMRPPNITYIRRLLSSHSACLFLDVVEPYHAAPFQGPDPQGNAQRRLTWP